MHTQSMFSLWVQARIHSALYKFQHYITQIVWNQCLQGHKLYTEAMLVNYPIKFSKSDTTAVSIQEPQQ